MIFERISKLCKERGISIAKLEKMCGLGNATIRGWKKGRPHIDTLQKVCAVLGVSVSDLIGEDTA